MNNSPDSKAMLISVHLPKTAGTSFREILESHYGENLLKDYDDRPLARGNMARNFNAFRNWILPHEDYRDFECVHGHFLPLKYRNLKNTRFAVWLRDPIERVVSMYFHYHRNMDTSTPQFRKYLKSTDLTLEEFVHIRQYHNMYHKFLFGMKLEDFEYVGITENFSASIAIFKKMFGMESGSGEVHANLNPNKGGRRYELDEQLRQSILHYNYKDQEIYQKGLLINRELEKQYLG